MLYTTGTCLTPLAHARQAFVHVDASGTDDHKRATGVGELGDVLDLSPRLAHDACKADVTPLTPRLMVQQTGVFRGAIGRRVRSATM
jgi:hypothetical protein